MINVEKDTATAGHVLWRNVKIQCKLWIQKEIIDEICQINS